MHISDSKIIEYTGVTRAGQTGDGIQRRQGVTFSPETSTNQSAVCDGGRNFTVFPLRSIDGVRGENHGLRTRDTLPNAIRRPSTTPLSTPAFTPSSGYSGGNPKGARWDRWRAQVWGQKRHGFG